jgi:hypothetical protein
MNSTDNVVGRLDFEPLRKVFQHEAQHFTTKTTAPRYRLRMKSWMQKPDRLSKASIEN